MTPDTVNAVLSDPWIVARIRHDDAEPGWREGVIYTPAKVGSVLAGLFMQVHHSPREIEVHVAIRRPYMRSASVLAHEFLTGLWANNPDLQRITAPVLAILPTTANWCRKLGFRDEGVRRAASSIDGKPVDVLMLGMLRGELKSYRLAEPSNSATGGHSA